MKLKVNWNNFKTKNFEISPAFTDIGSFSVNAKVHRIWLTGVEKWNVEISLTVQRDTVGWQSVKSDCFVTIRSSGVSTFLSFYMNDVVEWKTAEIVNVGATSIYTGKNERESFDLHELFGYLRSLLIWGISLRFFHVVHHQLQPYQRSEILPLFFRTRGRNGDVFRFRGPIACVS